jgi:hypothetical protein
VQQLRRRGVLRRALGLSIPGAAAFWLTNLVISWTPIAADYRSALSISYWPMLVEALLAGWLVALAVASCLLRFHDAIPGRTLVRRSLLVSAVVLAVVTVFLEVPAKFFTGAPHPVRYLLVGLAIDVLRILALGLVVGRSAERLEH